MNVIVPSFEGIISNRTISKGLYWVLYDHKS